MSFIDHPTTKQVFSIIGIVGTIIAILGGSFQFYKYYIEKPGLTVECIPSPIYLPPFDLSFDPHVPGFTSYKLPLQPEYRRLSSDLSPIEVLITTTAITTAWNYSIKNTGSTEVKDINFINDFKKLCCTNPEPLPSTPY